MPQIITRDLPAREIKPGNTLFGAKVIQVLPKRVYTFVTLESPVAGTDNYTFRLDDTVEVGIEELTPEELAEKERQYEQLERDRALKFLRTSVDDARPAVEAAKQAVVDEMWLSHWKVDELLLANAQARVWETVGDYLECGLNQTLHVHEEGVKCEYTEPTESGRRCVKPTLATTEWDGAVAAVKSLQKQLDHKVEYFRAMSRSTSIMSNYMEDLEMEVLSKILHKIRWMHGFGIFDR